MAILNNSNAISTTGGYDINNSLRFRSSASAYLNRTAGSTTNRQIFTWSGWVKRGTLGARQHIFVSANPVVNTVTQQEFQFCFDSSDKIQITSGVSGVSLDFDVVTTQVFRDPSAWYHIVVAIDTTQATAANRIKLYINGVQVTAFSTATYPAQNYNTSVNLTGFSHRIGGSGGSYLDAYQAEINFIDGSAKTPSDFGETDTTTGSWKPKAYTSTYGTNGFYLKFSDIATTSGSNAGLGKDFSGNANYWTTNNISVTAGTTYDAMIDSPTLTSATVANYAVWNPLSPTGATCADGNLQATITTSGKWTVGTFAVSSGKYYFECVLGGSTPELAIGIAPNSGTTVSSNALHYYSLDGNVYSSNSSVATGATFTSGDIIGVAFEPGGNAYFYKNNTLQATVSMPAGSDWCAEVYQTATRSNTATVNFGQRPFSYTPPTGFVRLNTYNLPDSTIKKGNVYMDATLFTGTSGAQSIVNAGAFKPDLVWIKARSNAQDNYLIDSVRDGTKLLRSNTTGAESTSTSPAFITSFNSNGFSSDSASLVTSGYTYVGWQWQAGQGTNTTNTSGTITSTVSVNTTAGFSVVTYTGIGSSPKTVGHGLGVAPKMIILKSRGAAVNWYVWHTSLGATQVIEGLNTTAAAGAQTTFNNTLPTSSVISLGNNDSNNSGSTYVLYVWAEIAGFSKFGSYTGNGSADGPFVYTGFRPKFIMLKRTDSTGSWGIFDVYRSVSYNPQNGLLNPNRSDAEYVDATYTPIDFLSNGFKIRNIGSEANAASGATYIYAAFAENPLKNSLAR